MTERRSMPAQWRLDYTALGLNVLAGGDSAAEGSVLPQSLRQYGLVLLKSCVYSLEHVHARDVPMARLFTRTAVTFH